MSIRSRRIAIVLLGMHLACAINPAQPPAIDPTQTAQPQAPAGSQAPAPSGTQTPALAATQPMSPPVIRTTLSELEHGIYLEKRDLLLPWSKTYADLRTLGSPRVEEKERGWLELHWSGEAFGISCFAMTSYGPRDANKNVAGFSLVYVENQRNTEAELEQAHKGLLAALGPESKEPGWRPPSERSRWRKGDFLMTLHQHRDENDFSPTEGLESISLFIRREPAKGSP